MTKKVVSTIVRLLVAAFFILTVLLPAFGDTVQATLTGNGLFSWGGVYVSPYQANITYSSNPAAVPTGLTEWVCLDLTKETYVGQSYSYTVSYGPGLGTSYDKAAVLSQMLMGATGDQRGIDAFAIWYLIDPTAVTGDSAVASYLTQIEDVANGVSTAGGVPQYEVFAPSGQSQRYLELAVPDGGVTVILLGVALVGLEALRRRFRA